MQMYGDGVVCGRVPVFIHGSSQPYGVKDGDTNVNEGVVIDTSIDLPVYYHLNFRALVLHNQEDLKESKK